MESKNRQNSLFIPEGKLRPPTIIQRSHTYTFVDVTYNSKALDKPTVNIYCVYYYMTYK